MLTLFPILAGNEGFRVGKEVANIPAYRQSFADGYFKGDNNLYDYSADIAGTSARPFGTTFEGMMSCLYIVEKLYKIYWYINKLYFTTFRFFVCLQI